MSKQIRWGILGAARVNERLLPAILQAENAQLVAIASRRAGAAAALLQSLAPERSGIIALDDPLALLMRDDIDAVYLPMANEEHAHWAMHAIKAEKHVLIEKPMALKVADIDAIKALADKANVKVMEGFMYRFHPQHQAVEKIIDSGAIGEVRMVRTCFSFPMKEARMYRIDRSIANGGGAMWDIGPYAIHTARLWFDQEPESVMAMAKLNQYGADVSLAGMFDFSEGRYAQFEISFEHARRSEYEIIGTLGGIKCHIVWQHAADKPVISWWTDAGQREQLDLAAADHFVMEIEHFSDCILNDTTPMLSLGDARANCAAIEAALSSASQGKRVSING